MHNIGRIGGNVVLRLSNRRTNCKCAFVWNLSVPFPIPRGVNKGRKPKFLWMQLDILTPNQSNKTFESGNHLGFSMKMPQ